jgi:hypothetical protein
MEVDFLNPHDSRNYTTFKASPYYIEKANSGMNISGREDNVHSGIGDDDKTRKLIIGNYSNKKQCTPFNLKEKKIFKITGVASVILLILSIFIFSLSTTFSIVAALMPLLIFGVLIPYLTIREIIFYARNYFSR